MMDFPPLPPPSAELKRFLLSPENIPIHDIRAAQRLWSPEPCPDRLYHAECCPPHTDIAVERDPMLGKLLGFHEIEVSTVGLTAKNSTSLRRAPGPPTVSVKGEATNYPFWPGGQDELEIVTSVKQDLSQLNLNLESDLLTVPPSFEKGMTFDSEVKATQNSELAPPPETVNISEVLLGGGDMVMEWGGGGAEEEEKKAEDLKTEALQQDKAVSAPETKEALDEVLGGVEVEKPQSITQDDGKTLWAVKVDSNSSVEDFYEKVPKMAHTWPFEPDPFQKQAILHLERHDSVFVAAHTSAGKTVVAEYAIALSLQHLTRTIYTSPIKALSNQKFRDFRQTFGEKNVGLLTGDVHIKSEAPCLIMTTEILRSMLYNGSDVIRDVEWVIFDEVHYINDSERGVVWEEVLIMLPDHIGIVMLSATVPNSVEFASWVGRTKRKKMYVISTFKRPVPLRHYLYTGNSKQTNDQLFDIVGENKRFNTAGYRAAMQAKKERTSKAAAGFGAKVKHYTNPKEEKNVWLSLVHMLEKKDKLPMVAFTFSRARCDSNADSLSSLDLTTSTEKSEIHIFFKKSTTLLKGSDQHLPQVVWMRDILKRGIGVHHSGILPIMKEVIEMLFQRGLVKLLFATETFAMGVNMPARTVVFDATQKFDGVRKRDLYPGEYIQMAGRAGRRGKDILGTVILLCKADVPEASDLQRMILGQPTTLQSQFRLTYSMLLNLMRVETLRVEDMMKRSYAENDTTRHEVDRKQSLQQLETDIGSLEQLDCPACDTDLDHYYASCKSIKRLQRKMQTYLLSHPNALKALSPGRVVTLYTNAYHYSLAVVLQQHSSKTTPRSFTVLLLCKAGDDTEERVKSLVDVTQKQYEMVTPYVPLIELFTPDGEVRHAVVTVDGQLVFNITEEVVSVDPKKIVDDYSRRQIPRFRDSPPGQVCVMATQTLLRLTEAFPTGIAPLEPVKHLRITDMEFVQMRDEREKLESTMDYYSCKRCPQFEEHFHVARKKAELQERLSSLRFMLSEASLQLLPEYKQRIQVMKSLGFLRGSVVELKGCVACELHSHEILLTELVFQNIFNEFEPAEIAALLSCVVFQQGRCSEPTLNERLQKGQKMVLDVATQIALSERNHGIDTSVEDYLKELKFGLVEVVYEWARGMEFVEITNLTDVSEGIIVRCIQRLDETCRDVRNAARVIGDPLLYQKMQTCSTLIKRDIVFAASLYTI